VTNNYPHDNSPSPSPATKISVHDYYRRIGLVFYAQWRRHWTHQRCRAELLGLESFKLPNGELEDRLTRPRVWQRMRFCLDEQGRYHPE
jgi:hypothetical protein